MNILTIAYTAEGTTDKRFLGNIIRKTFEELCYECDGLIDVYEPVFISKSGDGFVEECVNASKEAKWAHVLCVHADADDDNDKAAQKNKIIPALTAINEIDVDDLCKNIVPIVPIHMTEAWMLADSTTLAKLLNTGKSPTDLRIKMKMKQIEKLSDPKEIINQAIDIAFDNNSKKRKRIEIEDLYIPMSQQIDLKILDQINSYRQFRLNAKNALIKLNYLHP
jgi:hypothetical protein